MIEIDRLKPPSGFLLPDKEEAALIRADQSVWKAFDRSKGPHADVGSHQVLRLHRTGGERRVNTGQSGSSRERAGTERQVVSCYRQLSESVKSCSVEPAAECSEQATLQADRATTAWTRPWQSSVWERLQLDSILLTRTSHSQSAPFTGCSKPHRRFPAAGRNPTILLLSSTNLLILFFN